MWMYVCIVHSIASNNRMLQRAFTSTRYQHKRVSDVWIVEKFLLIGLSILLLHQYKTFRCRNKFRTDFFFFLFAHKCSTLFLCTHQVYCKRVTETDKQENEKKIENTENQVMKRIVNNKKWRTWRWKWTAYGFIFRVGSQQCIEMDQVNKMGKTKNKDQEQGKTKNKNWK